MKIIILYSEVMGYTLACIEQLCKNYDITVYLVGWNQGKKTPFSPKTKTKNLIYKTKDKFKTKELLLDYAKEIKPSTIFVSGWMDQDYLYVVKKMRKRGVKIVSFLDNQWKGSFRQYVSCVFSKILIKRYFDTLWVSGVRQYEFARRLGYNPSNIFMGFYSADISLFNHSYRELKGEFKDNPKNILYVGRLHPRKGLELLIEIFKEISLDFPGWSLTLIGDGPLKSDLVKKGNDKIIFKDFMSSQELAKMVRNSSFFCLPSKYEAWGVVIHEFCAAGLPILCSNAVGASTTFVVPDYNGLIFESENKSSLTENLRRMLSLTSSESLKMRERSHLMAQHLNLDTWASTCYNIIKKI